MSEKNGVRNEIIFLSMVSLVRTYLQITYIQF